MDVMEETKPLLNESEDIDHSSLRKRTNCNFDNLGTDNKITSVNSSSVDPSYFLVENTSEVIESTDQFSDQQTNCAKIVCIFVVAFDTKAGNVIEWYKPSEMDISGIEFKALTSGSHTQHKDFVFFYKRPYYGLACFENLPVESDIERGARMKSVGILSTSFSGISEHMDFLELQVKHLLEKASDYTQLETFYENNKSVLPSCFSDRSDLKPTLLFDIDQIVPQMQILHPVGCFSQFIDFFSEYIFVIWKFAILRKRIIFFSPPPIGVVCYRVYCAWCLTANSYSKRLSVQRISPYFYINVTDINELESSNSYVACTTEKIFQSKKHLYDIYLDNQNVTTESPLFKKLINVSKTEKSKFAQLKKLKSSLFFEELSDDPEAIFINFFQKINDSIFQTLLEISDSESKTLNNERARSIGFDLSTDREFFTELVKVYSFDIEIEEENPCCQTM